MAKLKDTEESLQRIKSDLEWYENKVYNLHEELKTLTNENVSLKSKLKSQLTLGCLVVGLLIIFSTYCYVHNLIKLVYCDFDAPYKEEAIHALGVLFLLQVLLQFSFNYSTCTWRKIF